MDNRNMSVVGKMIREESGQGMVEYALIVALIGVGLITVLTALGSVLKNFFGNASNKIQSIVP